MNDIKSELIDVIAETLELLGPIELSNQQCGEYILTAIIDQFGEPRAEERTVIDAWVIPSEERQERRLVFPWEEIKNA